MNKANIGNLIDCIYFASVSIFCYLRSIIIKKKESNFFFNTEILR